MRIVIFFPSDLIRELLQDREDVCFFDEGGLEVFDGVVKRIYFNEKNKNYLIEPAEIIKNLRMNGPLWSRWVAKGDQFELLMRDALIDIYKLSECLLDQDIRIAIFNTGVTHHIDTLICEQACIVAGVEQVFLYTNNIMLGRLLPLLQKRGISDRRVLDARVSTEKSTCYLDRFVLNKRENQPPEAGGELPSRLKHSYCLALLSVALLFFKKIVKKILGHGKPSKNNLLLDFSSYSNYFGEFDFLRQLNQQRLANKYYFKHVSNIFHLSDKKEIKILFAAHYQPEATSFPEGGELHNSIDILIELRRRGYSGAVVYKEHPASFYYKFPIIGYTRVGMARSKKYYSQLKRMGCVFMSPKFELSVDESKNYWYLPVTITGTIAIERALMGFHTVVTGYPWFKDMPGVLNLSEIKSFRKINPKWVKRDLDLAKKAYEYLKNVLDEKTISNPTGIGTGKEIGDEKTISHFKAEINNLISALMIRHKP